MWISARELADYVQDFQSFDDPEAVKNLVSLLNKYQSKLQNITKNTGFEKVQTTNGVIEIGVHNQKVELNPKICEEAAILAKLFSMPESEAIELVLTADLQVHNFEGLPRGLTAVVCYYDAHRLFGSTLKRILSWDREVLPSKLLGFIMENLVKPNIMQNLIEVQRSFTITSEFHLLVREEVNGLGGAYHRSLLRASIEDIRLLCAECAYEICRWAVGKQQFLGYIFQVLKEIPGKGEKLQAYQIITWTCFSIMLSNQCLLQSNDETAILTQCNREISNEAIWKDIVTYGSVCLIVAIAIKNLSLSPADHSAISELASDLPERLIERAVHFQCFHYISRCILAYEDFKAVDSQVQAVDDLLKEFCTLFPSKMTELMRHGVDEMHIIDEIRSNKGVVSITPQKEHFCTLLHAFSELYRSDPRLDTLHPSIKTTLDQLSEDFTPDKNLQLCHSFLALSQLDDHYRQTVTFLQTLCDISRNPVTASYIFNMFLKTPLNIDYDHCNLWARFVNALRKYEVYFREASQTSYKPMSSFTTEKTSGTISKEELAGMLVWCRLVETITKMDDNACQVFGHDRNWQFIETATSLISRAIPVAMKGALLRLLASLARLPSCAEYIWITLNASGICAYGENGRLIGLVKELEERECTSCLYECSLGMMHLLRALFAHSNIPITARPYLEYATTCVLWPLSTRSYKSITQMWELCETAMDALYSLLSNNHFDARSLEVREPAAVILLQILNREAPLFRTICWVLLEDSASAFLPYRLSRSAALSALKLLYECISKLEILRVALRTTENNSVVSSMSVLLLSPLHQDPTKNLLSIVINYISNLAAHPMHALMSVYLLRELCSTRPSLQQNIVSLLTTDPETQKRLVRAAYMVLDPDTMSYTIDNVYLRDTKEFFDNSYYIRGETARVFLEVLADSIEIDPSVSNLGFLFLGLELSNDNGLLYNDASQRTALHRLLSFISLFCSTDDPLSLRISAVFQPLFRVLRGLVSVKSGISPAVLRFLRTYDVVYSLATSPFLGLHAASLKDDSTSTRAAISDLIAGDILHLIALEFSSLMLHGYYSDPQRLLRVLLENVRGGAEVEINETAWTRLPEEKNVLFAVLSGASQELPVEIQPPINLAYFDSAKLGGILETCIRGSVWGTPVYDVEYLHFLLRREIQALSLEDPAAPKQEMERILSWTTTANSYELLSNAHSSLISGCSAFLNVLCIFSPLPFFTNTAQINVLRDSLYELVAVGSTHDGELGDEIAASITRVCKALCKLVNEEKLEKSQKRELIEMLISPVLELLVQPGMKTLQSKMSLYLATYTLVSTCYSPPVSETTKEASVPFGDTTWLFEPLAATVEDPIRLRIDSLTQELSTSMLSDISDLPNELKSAPLTLLAALVWEDTLGSRRTSGLLVQHGLIRILLNQLSQISLDFAKLVVNNGKAQLNYKLFRSIMSVFTRLCFVEVGWTAITEAGVIQVLKQLPYLMQPPKEVFLQPASLQNVQSTSWYYGEALTSVMYFISAIFSHSHWKKTSKNVIEFISIHAEVFCQLCRAELKFPPLELASSLLNFIHENDDITVKDVIQGSPSLRMILGRSKEKSENLGTNNVGWIHKN
ncbi:unnamed protein product, partial [Mesorhabditis belari]|uniref:Uncharacterized protein n=1 Tax=Mesorhabditis belari TaxID=2138241 RepID=A0AAF3J9A9_9BILA